MNKQIRQVTRLELTQHQNANTALEVLTPIETALALAYIARELAKKNG